MVHTQADYTTQMLTSHETTEYPTQVTSGVSPLGGIKEIMAWALSDNMKYWALTTFPMAWEYENEMAWNLRVNNDHALHVIEQNKDTDDGTIAASQVVPLNINLLHGYDGTNWKRLNLAHGTALSVCTQDHLTTKSINYAGAQANGIVISPGATKSLCIDSIYVSTNDKLTDIEFNEETSDDLLFKLYTTNQQTTTSANLHIDTVVGKDLLITCGAGTFVQVCYVEE